MICREIKTLRVVGNTTDLKSMVDRRRQSYDLGEEYRLYSWSIFHHCVRQLVNLESIELLLGRPKQPERFERYLEAIRSLQMSFLLYDIQASPSLRVKSLKSKAAFWNSPLCIGLEKTKNLASLQPIINSVGFLSALEVKLTAVDPGHMAIQVDRLQHFLFFARNLETLTLNFGVSDQLVLDPLYDFGQMLHSKYHRLRSISLSCGNILQWVLLEFLEVHDTLRELRLGSMHLRGGRWHTLINRMAGSQLALEKIQFSGELVDGWLLANGAMMCGEHATPTAEEIVVHQRGGQLTIASDQSMQESLDLDREAKERREAAGLPCDLCETCGRLEHTSEGQQ